MVQYLHLGSWHSQWDEGEVNSRMAMESSFVDDLAIWRFPNMKVPPNHRQLNYFSIETYGLAFPVKKLLNGYGQNSVA